MAGQLTSTEALQQAADAVGKYIKDVEQSIQGMRKAATDCRDNLGGDALSSKAIDRLDGCIKQLSAALEKAEKLRRDIQNASSDVSGLDNSL